MRGKENERGKRIAERYVVRRAGEGLLSVTGLDRCHTSLLRLTMGASYVAVRMVQQRKVLWIC